MCMFINVTNHRLTIYEMQKSSVITYSCPQGQDSRLGPIRKYYSVLDL